MSIRATCRVQFRNGFSFADATAIVPYLAALGISHLYASPIAAAPPGSTHGYDAADVTRIDPELGGEEGFRQLVAALRAHGMGAIVDIVPNHMGIVDSENHWWQDILEKGQRSAYACYFDIDWSEKLLLPFLGEPLPGALEQGALQLHYDAAGERLAVTARGSQSFPIRREDYGEVLPALERYSTATGDGRRRLAELLERQHYRLAWWRTANDELNWRRFFSITELAALRVEDPVVFEATHALWFRLYSEGLIDGVRVDHVDGLSDPAAYCQRLRDGFAARQAARPAGVPRGPALLVVEKILAFGESLAPEWGMDGASGYDFMGAVSALLHAPAGREALGRYWAEVSGRKDSFPAEELEARREILASDFEGPLSACVRAFKSLAEAAPATAALTAGMLRRALERLLWVIPVYRTYGTGSDAPAADARVRRLAAEQTAALPANAEQYVVDHILCWLAGTGPGDSALAVEAVRRFQQLAASLAAKAVEDTAFYRYGRLLSRNDVGSDPGLFALGTAEFHAWMTARCAASPRALSATATHDHKCGEDVRARLAALSEIPDEWLASVERWNALNRAASADLDPGDVYRLYQMLVGACPRGLRADDAAGLCAFGGRLAAWQQKALREARLRSSWAAPNEAYEVSARVFVEAILDPVRSRAFLEDFTAFARRLAPAGERNSLVQTFLRCTAPGIPDLYQGTEFEDLTLVDPDNRRPVDFALRASTLERGAADTFDGRKQALIARLLEVRSSLPELFERGSYEPVPVEGLRAAHVLCFVRRHNDAALFAAVALHCSAGRTGSGTEIAAEWWDDTRVEPGGELTRSLTRTVGNGAATGTLLVAGLLSGSAVHLSLHGPGAPTVADQPVAE